mmetsp:Transcript_73444/g.147925  ORF Transcript_73444/g.147925 Transcript_73444/m.147925 type:complete len:226 (-) Transcript_73444:2945-3622(-)
MAPETSSGSVEPPPSKAKATSRPTCFTPLITALRSCCPTCTLTVASFATATSSVMKPFTVNEYVVAAAKLPAGSTSTRGFREVPLSLSVVNRPPSSRHSHDIFALARLLFESSARHVSLGSVAATASRNSPLRVAVVTGFSPWILKVGAGSCSFSRTTLAVPTSLRKLVAFSVTVKVDPRGMAAEGTLARKKPSASLSAAVRLAVPWLDTPATLHSNAMPRPPLP